MEHVSRGTSRAPDEAQGLFGPRLELAERYAGWLADQGALRGLIGPRESSRLWQRHLINSALVADLVPAGASVCDVGSGAGLPGLVLAIVRPDLHVTLVEPLLRRTTFLDEVVADLELSGVEVVRGRADALHGRRTFDVVTSRAVAPLITLVGWSMPLVSPTGSMVAMKGSSVAEEIPAARQVLAELGCSAPEVLTLRHEGLDQPTTCVQVAWADPTGVRWPLPAGPGGARKRQRGKAGRRGRGDSP